MEVSHVSTPAGEPGAGIPDPIPLPRADFDGPDRPSPGAGALSARPLRVDCPRGRVEPLALYDLWAVRCDADDQGQPDVVSAVSLGPVDSVMRGQVLTQAYCLQPGRYGIADMDAVVLKDAAGATVLRREIVAA